ncbi:MAG TPA: chalcone isomerase family protein [Nevskia sp.]|nr:chalcone isomerase family protein [Nevskia sp.]
MERLNHRIGGIVLLAAAAAAMPAASMARTVEDVELKDSVQIGGASLSLNGAGLRSKFGLFGVYVAGLYLPQKSSDADSIVKAHEPRRLVLKMRRSVGTDKMTEAFHEGVANNLNAQQLAALKPKLDLLDRSLSGVSELKEGDEIDLDFGADGSTRVTYNGQQKDAIPGADLSEALLKIWLGRKPVQDDLKQELLGQG